MKNYDELRVNIRFYSAWMREKLEFRALNRELKPLLGPLIAAFYSSWFSFFFQFSYLYFISFGGIFAGLITYNWTPTPVAPRRRKKSKEDKESKDETSKQTEEKRKIIPNGTNGKIPYMKYNGNFPNGISATKIWISLFLLLQGQCTLAV